MDPLGQDNESIVGLANRDPTGARVLRPIGRKLARAMICRAKAFLACGSRLAGRTTVADEPATAVFIHFPYKSAQHFDCRRGLGRLVPVRALGLPKSLRLTE